MSKETEFYGEKAIKDLLSKREEINKELEKFGYKDKTLESSKDLEKSLVEELFDIPSNDNKSYLTLKLIKKEGFDTDTIREYIDKLDWHILSDYYTFTQEEVIEFKDRISIINLNVNTYKNLSFDFIRENKSNINWQRMSYIDMGFEFLLYFKDSIDWNVASLNYSLTENQIEMLSDKVNWTNITLSQDLSENFLIKWCDKLDASYILLYKPSEEVKELYRTKIEERKEYHRSQATKWETSLGGDIDLSIFRDQGIINPGNIWNTERYMDFLDKHDDKEYKDSLDNYVPEDTHSIEDDSDFLNLDEEDD